MGVQTYATFIEPDQEVLIARNKRFLEALVKAHPVTAQDIVMKLDRRAEAERRQRLQVVENHVERLIERVDRVVLPLKSAGEEYSALRNARLPVTTSSQIIDECCLKHGVSVAEITSARRLKRIVHARQEAMYRIYDKTNLSLPQIGNKLGGRDHTTVLHGCRAHAKRTDAPDVVAARREAS